MPTSPPKACGHPGCGKPSKTGYCDTHKDEANRGRFADKARGTRHERGYGTSWDKTRITILKRDGGLCQPCLSQGRVTPAKQVDHITPKARGGTDDHGNLQAICVKCHQAKTAGESR